MQAVKQASVPVSENGEEEEEEETEFGEEDLFHQQVRHAASHLVGLQVQVPQSCLRQPGHPLLGWGRGDSSRVCAGNKACGDLAACLGTGCLTPALIFAGGSKDYLEGLPADVRLAPRSPRSPQKSLKLFFIVSSHSPWSISR